MTRRSAVLIGFAVPVSGAWATPANQVLIAQRAEELGYHSLWTLQRLVNPADTADHTYRNVSDPLITLAYLAGYTSRVRLGVAIVNVPFTSPPLLAKQAATLDHVTGGRLDLGLGLGWMPAEFAATGVPMERRGARAEEFVAALRSLWADEVSEFHGEFYDIPPVLFDPKPLQSPEPPILMGGSSEPALRRAGRLAAGWVSSSRADLAGIGRSIEIVRESAEKAGRDPAALRFVCRGAVRVRPAGAPGRRPLTGSHEEIRSDFGVLAEQGVTELFVDVNFDPELTGPDADPWDSMYLAREALDAFAPPRL
ncbi:MULTISPECIES: TIGR03619 family F420-dependent LLM class oxidoreductase [Thermomonosporaceae]|uniref:TIGR03619 family F420-dependent LLM class oxidoreductase n=1 Tax=Thermomonosporaceae TaxID=2012 RepID=UPI00255B34EB|nr:MULTISPECIES: TIGR03619 family F420-dependent LLM class oxidoreductase [Thermomonosporaceae]MDL4776989.1 TIGR03619 family F420-dependent LLM class oxidoreductase [Actinomadura xylanilytica]